MPNCFQLISKTNAQAGPVSLQQVDRDLCFQFNEPCHPKDWFHGWFDYIGFAISMGKDFAWIRKECTSYIAEAAADEDFRAYWTKMLKINDYLEANYITNAFAEVGKW